MPVYMGSDRSVDELADEGWAHCGVFDYTFVTLEGVQTKRTMNQFSKFDGMVVQLYERNGYDDSDFVAVWYDIATDTSGAYEYASTRFGCPGCGASIDASDEVMDAYKAHVARAKAKAAKEQMDAEVAELRLSGLSEPVLVRLIERIGRHECYGVIKRLLKTQSFRSEFRKSLRDQIIAWANEDEPKYTFPLSPAQVSSIMKWERA